VSAVANEGDTVPVVLVTALLKAVFVSGAPKPGDAAFTCLADRGTGPGLIVRKLYDGYTRQGKPVELEPKAVLEKFYTSRLASLLVEDHECTVKEDGPCALSFSVMFGPWDWGDGDVRVGRVHVCTPRKDATVDVWFDQEWSLGTDKRTYRIVVSYFGADTQSGWRIRDVQYQVPANWERRQSPPTLSALLSNTR